MSELMFSFDVADVLCDAKLFKHGVSVNFHCQFSPVIDQIQQSIFNIWNVVCYTIIQCHFFVNAVNQKTGYWESLLSHDHQFLCLRGNPSIFPFVHNSQFSYFACLLSLSSTNFSENFVLVLEFFSLELFADFGKLICWWLTQVLSRYRSRAWTPVINYYLLKQLHEVSFSSCSISSWW